MIEVGDYVIREHSSGKCYGIVAIIQENGKLKVRPMVLPDKYFEAGTQAEQYEEAGLNARYIEATALN